MHPYLTVGEPLDACTVRIPGGLYQPVDDRMIPIGAPKDVAGSEYDLRAGRVLGDQKIDIAYTGLARGADGLARVRLTGSRRSTSLWLDQAQPWLEIYTADHDPGGSAAARAGLRADDRPAERVRQRRRPHPAGTGCRVPRIVGDRGGLTDRCPAPPTTSEGARTMPLSASVTSTHNHDLEHADILVLYGITGDLAKKMLLPALYKLTERGMLTAPVVGVAYSDFDDEALRAHARQSVIDAGYTIDEKVFAKFAADLSIVTGDFTDPAIYAKIGRRRSPGRASPRTTWRSRPRCSTRSPPVWPRPD